MATFIQPINFKGLFYLLLLYLHYQVVLKLYIPTQRHPQRPFRKVTLIQRSTQH